MAEYKIVFTTGASTSVVVEAEDVASAVEAAWQSANAQLCHYCARDVELGDDWEPDEHNYWVDGEFVSTMPEAGDRMAELDKAAQAAQKAADGDSNDSEVTAWRALAEQACAILGVGL